MGMQVQPAQSVGRSRESGQGSGQRCQAALINQQETCGTPWLHPDTGQSKEGWMGVVVDTSGHLVLAQMHKKPQEGQLNHYQNATGWSYGT